DAKDDGSRSGDKVTADNDGERVSESSCMHNNDLLYDNNHNNIMPDKDKVLSEDPFIIYDILNKRKDSGDDLKYPPSFTPSVINVEEVKGATSNEVNEHVNFTSNKLEESVPKGKLSSNNSVCSKRVHTGSSILQLMDELVKGNSFFDYALSSSFGNSGGILCVWEPTLFVKDNVTSFDNFLAVMGTWVPSSSKLLIISVYAPQDLTEKRVLWDYILRLIDRWDGDCVIMGDFNEVRTEQERYGSVFNVQGANAFNSFISLASLIDLPLDGYAYTWAHKTANKMSKLDRFLVSKGLLASFSYLSALCLDRNLSDHRPILMRELSIDYGPTPFRFFHSWFNLDGFDKMVEDTWKSLATVDSNGMINLKKKLQALKIVIKQWTKNAKKSSYKAKISIQSKLSDIDKILDQGGSNEEILSR
ncbi:RNA-directed DNA polymerase, eukaryota, partial [Tanacetum coccineum]